MQTALVWVMDRLDAFFDRWALPVVAVVVLYMLYHISLAWQKGLLSGW